MNQYKYLMRLMPVCSIVLVILIMGSFNINKAVTVISENRPYTQRSVMIIDPGHGGEDGGATSCTGVLESQINLEIALRLNDLMHLLGVDTYMIRDTDVSIYTEGNSLSAKKISDLKQRVKIANSINNAILVSIHQNYYPDSRYGGAQVFYAESSGSEVLAKELQEKFVSSINPGSARLAKKASGIYLMKHVKCSAVLVECGFLSNYQEEAKLRDAFYQKKICCVKGVVCSDYFVRNQTFS